MSVFQSHALHMSIALLQRGNTAILGWGRGRDEEVLGDAIDSAHQLLGHDHPAQPAAGHCIPFREAVDNEDVVVERQGRLDLVIAVDQTVVDLVGNDGVTTLPEPLVGSLSG